MRVTMPCGHPSKLLSGLVVVCAFDCDVKPTEPYCDKCRSTDLVKHNFGTAPHEQHYNKTLPNAVRCRACNNVMHHGGLR